MQLTLATARKHAIKGSDLDAGKNGNNPIFYAFGQVFPCEQFAHEIIRMRHTGYYTDDNFDGLTRGIVAELPAMPGFNNGRFIAGYHWGDNDERVFYPAVFDNAEDAARAADSHAELFAELQREDNAKFNAARDLESDIESNLQRLRECIVLRNRACLSYVRDEMRGLVQKIKDARQSLKNEYAEYC